jgi:putative serine protease PepD
MTSVRFGGPGNGIETTIVVDTSAGDVGTDPAYVTAPQQDPERTVLPTDLDSTKDDRADAILIRTRDGDKRFGAGKVITIGRDEGSEVVADDPVVSRQHADVQRRTDDWWYVDHSNSGSFIDGEAVKEKEITDETVVQLGHPTAGYQLTLVPISDVESAQKAISGKRWRRRGVLVGAAIAVIVLVAAGVAASVLWPRPKPEQPGLSAAHLERAKKASVQIIAMSDGERLWRGSGSIISPDGLIITNAHVAKPTAKGMQGASGATDPDGFLVAFANDDDTPAAPKYHAKSVVAEGYLDLAVIKIDANADGTPLSGGKPDLPEPMPIGDSNALHTGDRITTLGYPGLTADHRAAGPLTVTSGDVSAFKRDYATDTDRFWIDTTARIAHGNSGGAAINTSGELVAVNTRYETGKPDDPVSFLTRPIALAADLIKVAHSGGDPDYVSPFLAKVKKLPDNAKVSSAGWSKPGSGGCKRTMANKSVTPMPGAQPGDVLVANFQMTDIPADTPFTILFVSNDLKLLGDPIRQVWTLGNGTVCIGPKLQTEAGMPSTILAVLDVGYQDEIEIINPVKFG